MSNFSHTFLEPSSNFSTFVDVLRFRGSTQPNRDAFTFLLDGEIEQATLTYQELERRSRRIAAQLQKLGLTGERALLLYPASLDFLVAFCGCLYAGVIAVTAYPPRNQRNTPRIKAIATDAQAAIALTTTEILPTVRSLMTETTGLESLQWLTTDNLAEGIEDTWQEPLINQDTLAFLQYTSGSTGTPKGVMISHGNLLHNADTTYQFMGHSPESKFVTWLPMYHDMGLIGGILQPLYGGFPCMVMPPTAFLQRPYRWLQTISKYKGTTSGGPNFAYELCTQKITPEQKATLDLSSWSVAFNGAEPVRHDTLERFAAAFAECGFRKQAFYPCYGMAEATLMISGGSKHQAPSVANIDKLALEQNQVIQSDTTNSETQTFVSCGCTIPQQQVVIANPETLCQCAPNCVGEIWVSGPSVGHGYWNRPQDTQETFQAYLSDSGEGPFLRTGDLGFIQDRELFITGRAKDVIILRGRNLYPQDLEFTAEHSHSALRLGGNVAAFTIESEQEEKLVIVQELEFRQQPEPEAVAAAIRQAIAAEFEVQVYAVVLIKPGKIPKTSSGKIQRRACKAAFLSGNLAVYGSSILKESSSLVEAHQSIPTNREAIIALPQAQQHSSLTTWLQQQVAAILKVSFSQINPQQPLISLGIDSLTAFEFKNAIAHISVSIPIEDLFAGATIEQLATQILHQWELMPEPIDIASIPLAPVQASYPLSSAQKRLWFLQQVEPDNFAYNIAASIQLTGKLNLAALTDSLNALMQRHQILRTAFISLDNQPVQVVREEELTLPIVDLTHIASTEQSAEVQRQATEQAQQPFNLSQAPLLRVLLLRLGEQEHTLLLTIHHIIADGWSMGVLLRELVVLYEANCQQQPASLTPLPIQYQDFAVWQQQWLGTLQTQLNYWMQQLAGELPILELPSDRPRPAVQSNRGARWEFMISPSLTKQLKTLSQQENVTLFMLLLAGFKTLLYRYTRQTDILVGTPLAGRPTATTEKLLGCFINTLVLRTDLSGNPRFTELLAQVRQVALAAYAHQDLPFESLLEVLKPARNLSHTPIFQVSFVLQNAPIMSTWELPELTLYPVELDNGTAKLDLTLYMVETPQGLVGSFEYNTDLFDVDTMNRMAGHLQTLLAGIVDNPDEHLEDLPLLTDVEQQQIFSNGQNPQTDYPQNLCIHQLFAESVKRTPEAIALVYKHESLTYTQLNQRAIQLAQYLQQLGVKSEVRVGICLERSLELMVAVLGVLQAGGAYVPLDPNYPSERLSFMLETAQASILLTQQALVEKLPPTQAQVICLDTDWHSDQISSIPTTLSNHTTPDSLAYIIFTSGSTGQAKGVMIQHQSLVNAYFAWEQAYNLQSEIKSHLQMASFAFDVFTGDWVRALCSGGKLVLCDRDLLLSPPQLYEYIREHQIDCAEFVPAVLRLLMQYLEDSGKRLEWMRLLICGSDNWYIDEYQRCQAVCGSQTRVINSFGLTEATIDSCYFENANITSHSSTNSLIPIGRPLANIQLYILDTHLHPVPVGVAGELYIGGAGLARGYLNRPDLTAASFIPHPFELSRGAEEQGSRRVIYKTGDLARWLADGNVELLGRVDAQEKIRGYRVELAEVESALNQHPSIQQAVVLAQPDSSGEKRLVAYIVQQPVSVPEPDKQAQLEAEQINQWQMVYDAEDALFKQMPGDWDATFNISGWTSSYTGLQIPPLQMQEWVDCGVEHILALNPSRVLEIGCGTGLLLFRIAPHCQEYWGLDFSQPALNYVQRVLDRSEKQWHHVKLLQGLADNLPSRETATFDTIIINSVIQHFPSIDYLLRVIERAIATVDGGTIFLGDLRSLPLLEAFRTSIELYKSPGTQSTLELKQRIQKQVTEEEELVIDPTFFLALPKRFPQISHVQIQPKPGRHHNEMTKFRYDVTLHIGKSVSAINSQQIQWQQWQPELTPDAVRQILLTTQPHQLGLQGVANARLQSEVRALELLNQENCPQTVDELRAILQTSAITTAIEPEDWQNLHQDYRVEISWTQAAADGSYDVLFQHNTDQHVITPQQQQFTAVIPWNTYANNPLQSRLMRELVPQLRTYLSEKLPQYMVPSAFMVLENLPLTPNGKVDRRALPVADTIHLTRSDNFVAPQTAIEQQLAQIWSEVLGLTQIGIDDNFFELGGHSLLATQIVAQIRDVFQVELPLRSLFATPTIATLSQAITPHIGESSSTKIPRQTQRDRLPLSFAQQRLWLLDRLETDARAYIETVAIHLQGSLDVAVLTQTLNEIVQRHEVLRTSFTVIDDEPVQAIAPSLTLALPEIDLRQEPASERLEKAQNIAAAAAQQPFDLSQLPLLRTKLLRLDDQKYLLLFTIHHIISDAWSAGVLIQEVTAIYTALIQGKPSPLALLPIQYADFAVWQRQWLQGEILANQLAYWKQQLVPPPPALELPVDQPSTTTAQGTKYHFSVPLTLSAGLKTLSQQTGVTLFMTLLASFQTLLHYYTKQTDIAVGCPIANRDRAEVQGLIGFFVNTLVLRTDFAGNPSFREILVRLRSIALDAYTHQDLPFEKLVAEIQPERHLSQSPLFNVWFVLQTALPPLELPGLILTPSDIDNGVVRHDLKLDITEISGGLTGFFEYKTDLFDAITITRMTSMLIALLNTVVTQPDLALSELITVLANAEQQLQTKQAEEFQMTRRQKLMGMARRGAANQA
ncbi:amino acid adenylation domain-containing protein [Nostocales cyanobacterium LEGE 11386]|nr:amino acid adenylation domain-containing protein [Nostocales cyanobacterium LEGE 11386]